MDTNPSTCVVRCTYRLQFRAVDRDVVVRSIRTSTTTSPVMMF